MDIKEVSSEISETELFDSAASCHNDISLVECLSLDSPEIRFECWLNVLRRICDHIKNKWMGIHFISVHYKRKRENEPENNNAAVAVSGDSVSLSTTTLEFITRTINDVKAHGELILDLICMEPEDEDNEEIIAPPEFVHIKANKSEVENWIKSFTQGKRNLINKQNINHFCTDGQRENCARVDAVLIKKKGSSGHIKVQDIENYWMQEEKKFPHIANAFLDEATPKQLSPEKKKKTFTAEELSRKLAQLDQKINVDER